MGLGFRATPGCNIKGSRRRLLVSLDLKFVGAQGLVGELPGFPFNRSQRLGSIQRLKGLVGCSRCRTGSRKLVMVAEHEQHRAAKQSKGVAP